MAAGVPRHTVPARQPQRRLLTVAELEALRCAARSGFGADATETLRLLDHVDIQHEVVLSMAKRAGDSHDERVRDGAQQALDTVAEDPPVRVRIEFELPPAALIDASFERFSDVLSRWDVQMVANLTDTGTVTVRYRSDVRTWEVQA